MSASQITWSPLLHNGHISYEAKYLTYGYTIYRVVFIFIRLIFQEPLYVRLVPKVTFGN